MTVLYHALLYIHVISVILSIGPFFIIVPMIKRLRTARIEAETAYLDTFRITVRVAKHAGHVLVVSGILLVFLGAWSWTTSWILITIIILVGSLLFLARAFSPTLRSISQSGNNDRDMLIQKLRKSTWIYIGLLMVMLWFMVAKPQLW